MIAAADLAIRPSTSRPPIGAFPHVSILALPKRRQDLPHACGPASPFTLTLSGKSLSKFILESDMMVKIWVSVSSDRDPECQGARIEPVPDLRRDLRAESG